MIVVTDAIGHLRKYPTMCLGHPVATAPQLACFVAEDALHLGVRRVSIEKVTDAWTVVSGSSNWFTIGPGSDLKLTDLFRYLLPFPEAGVNAVRHEIYLAAYCKDVFVKCGELVFVIAGDPPAESVQAELAADRFHVAFRL